MKKRLFRFTLIETLLSLGLIAFIMFFFFSEFRKQVMLKRKLMQAKELIFPRVHLQERLSQLFSKVETSKQAFKDTSISWLSSNSTETPSPCLTFLVHIGIDPDPLFRHLVMCRLTLNNTDLILEMIPLDPQSQNPLEAFSRKELLFKHVEAVSFEFYDDAPKRPSSQDDKNTFLTKTTWDLHEQELPAFVRLYLKLQEAPFSLEWSFQIRSKLNPIVFKNR